MSDDVPSVSIDEALALFFRLMSPPELGEADQSELVSRLQARVAADRPEWAQASGVEQAPQPTPNSSDDYAALKASIVEAAQQPEQGPEDPEERVLWERRRLAERNAEARREQEREDDARRRLRERALADKRNVDDATIERALRIRRELELRIQALGRPAALTKPNIERPSLGATGELSLGLPRSVTKKLERPTMSSPPLVEDEGLSIDADPEPSMSLSVDERVEMLRAYNAQRRARLDGRDEVLYPRRAEQRDTDRDERMRMDMSLELDDERRKSSSGMTLESAGTSRRRTWVLEF